MKSFKTKLLGVEITIHNRREDTLVSITRNQALNVLQWMDEDNRDETISQCDMEMRKRIANRTAQEVDTLFTTMYYLDMIKQPVCVWLEDILSWNGED